MRSAEKNEIIRELQDERRKDKVSFKNAFENVLMMDLPPHLKNLNNWFATVPEENPFIIKSFRRIDPSLQTSYCKDLSKWGLTPFSIGSVGQFIGSLLSRLKRRNVIDHNLIFVDLKSLSFYPKILIEEKYDLQKVAISNITMVNDELLLKFNRLNAWTLRYVYSEVPIVHLLGTFVANVLGVRQMNWRLRKDVASRLLEWTFSVSVYKPFIFVGWETKILNPNKLQLCCLSRADEIKMREFDFRWESRK